MAATRAVVLARGLGKRMRAADPSAVLDTAQATMADAGMKSMVPVGGGRPFLDYILSGLADAGFTEAILVIAPDNDLVRQRYSVYGPIGKPTRIRVMFAVQFKPTGTAEAVLAAEMMVPGGPFVVLNGDNYYPVSVMSELRSMPAPALPAFDAAALVAGGIPEERIASYATLDIASDGTLRGLNEKPGEGVPLVPGARISMNLWLLDKSIFQACREVPLSRRGERELPEAVDWAVKRLGVTFRTFPTAEPVLDLSHRADVAAVSERLAGVEVAL